MEKIPESHATKSLRKKTVENRPSRRLSTAPLRFFTRNIKAKKRRSRPRIESETELAIEGPPPNHSVIDCRKLTTGLVITLIGLVGLVTSSKPREPAINAATLARIPMPFFDKALVIHSIGKRISTVRMLGTAWSNAAA